MIFAICLTRHLSETCQRMHRHESRIILDSTRRHSSLSLRFFWGTVGHNRAIFVRDIKKHTLQNTEQVTTRETRVGPVFY